MFNENFLAYFSPNNPNSIVLQKMTPLSEELAQTYKDKGLNYVAEYRKGNPVALNLAALHEWGHQQAIVNSNPKDNLQYFSDFYRNDRLNEKRSKAIEYLYIANQYSQLKAQGVETVEYGGKKYPTESILDICPEIKNYLTENNFSIDDKKQVRDIVKIASDTWNTKHAKTYSYQLFTNAEVNMAADNIFQTLHQDEHAYNKVANDMLKKVHVGFNTNLDLRYCRDLLDDCTHEDVLIAVKDKKLNYVSTTFDEIMEQYSLWGTTPSGRPNCTYIDVTPGFDIEFNHGSTRPTEESNRFLQRGYESLRQMRFGLACALLGDGHYTFQLHTRWLGQHWWYQEYDIPIEKPLGAFYKAEDGTYRRDYENAVGVVNMSDHDVDRICRYHLSPINISFQTMNPQLRCKMLNNRFAGEALKKVDVLKEAGIEMNGQIVLCKGVNDGAELEFSITELALQVYRNLGWKHVLFRGYWGLLLTA